MRANRPSSTATLIAAATVLLARHPKLGHLVPAGAAEICARCLQGFWSVAPRLRWLAWAGERATIPGLMLHFILRKRWIEDAVRGALARGCRQVVVLGAGFDTLAARLAPQFPAVRFLEIDQLQHRIDPGFDFAFRNAKDFGVKAQNLLGRKELVVVGQFRQITDALPGNGITDINAENVSRACGRVHETEQHVHGCCFARAVRTEKPKDLALIDL